MTVQPLLDVRDLAVHFTGRRSHLWAAPPVVRAVDGVSFCLGRRRTLGLVGESGCGKSTTGLALARLVHASAGQALLDGKDMLAQQGEELRQVRRRVQIVFQDPYSSLNPRLTAGQSIREPLDVLEIGTPATRRDRVAELLQQVGLRPEHDRLYPHQFSGGQRQRLGIARALALKPELIICDEPVSALDVAIQAQILNLLARLQRENDLSFIFISHDLSVVRHVSDDVAVMYLGRIVEQAPTDQLFSRPSHPYTKALLSAVPSSDPDTKSSTTRIRLQGDIPAATAAPSGCRFRTRCPFARELCATRVPELRPLAGGHLCACHFAEELADDGELGAVHQYSEFHAEAVR